MIKSDELRQAIQDLGADGAHFRSRDVRERLGVLPSARDKVASIFKSFKHLEESGEIEEVPTGRKRNKLYRLAAASTGGKQEYKRGAVLPSVTEGGSAPNRLARMESSLKALESAVAQVDSKLDQLIAIWR